MIEAKIISHTQRSDTGEELITYELTFPRFILSEVNTYRMASKNTSSSRAIPFEKMIEVVKTNPFIPYAFQKKHSGMQGNDYFQDLEDIQLIQKIWLEARDAAVISATELNRIGVTKQICNRILEPFMWVKQLFTINRKGLEHIFEQRSFRFIGSPSWKEFTTRNPQFEKIKENFQKLLINTGQAEIHFSFLVQEMYDELQESVPKIDVDHIPYFREDLSKEDALKYSVAKTARISYTTVDDEEELSMEKVNKIYDKCLKSGHWSVFEHIGFLMNEDEYSSHLKGTLREEEEVYSLPSEAYGWSRNFKGFIQYREKLENKN